MIVAGALALTSFLISASLVRKLFREGPITPVMANMQYHFALYLGQSRSSFNADIVTGARRAAAESNASISIHTLDTQGIELNMASYIGVDGIVVSPNLDDNVTRQKLEKLRELKTPLVLVNHNVPSELPWPFIGTNNFDFGKKAGSLIRPDADSARKLRIAVVYSEKSPALYAERELVEMGINSVLSSRLLSPILGEHTDLNPRDAEKIVYQLVRMEPLLTTIIFTDSNDTLAGTQALIDLNMVGRVQIIGFGSVPGIREYIKKGIISGSLAVNPELIGYQAVKSLVELRSTGYTSTSVDIGIDVITGTDK